MKKDITDKVTKVYEVPRSLWELEQIMKEKPNYKKSEFKKLKKINGGKKNGKTNELL